MLSNEKRNNNSSYDEHPSNSDIKDIHQVVRQHYGNIATKSTEFSNCCASHAIDLSEKNALYLGYTTEELKQIPNEAKLGLGCGSPVGLSSIIPGETVVDLGSGGGIDCFLAAQKVGLSGKVIGVDMTPEMLDLARKNLRKTTFSNTEFRLGEIEHLPIADTTIDLVISNCVINLSSDKRQVFSEIYRILKPGGRMIISDIILEKKLPESILESVEAYAECITGALLRDDYINIIQSVGFKNFEILNQKHEESSKESCQSTKNESRVLADNHDITDKFSSEQLKQISESITSLTFKAVK